MVHDFGEVCEYLSHNPSPPVTWFVSSISNGMAAKGSNLLEVYGLDGFTSWGMASNRDDHTETPKSLHVVAGDS
jgi:hypothetical protein